MRISPPTLRIRRARLSDLPALVLLLGDLFKQESEFMADPRAQERGLRVLLRPGAPARVFVAVDSHQVAGMASLLLTTSTALGRPVAWLEDVVVRRDRRGRGIGGALLRHTLAAAHAMGVARVTLLTDVDNAGAQRLYRRLGFKSSPMVPMRWMP